MSIIQHKTTNCMLIFPLIIKNVKDTSLQAKVALDYQKSIISKKKKKKKVNTIFQANGITKSQSWKFINERLVVKKGQNTELQIK